MIKKIRIIYLATILPVLLLSACEKDGTPMLPAIKAFNENFNISGFVIGDTIVQYFDNVKIREYYGQVRTVRTGNQLAFTTDEINMELKRKSTGETIYRQTFNINDKQSIVPPFYFDGLKFNEGYAYPVPKENEYTANFYVESNGSSAPVDINIEVLEYYEDSTKPDPIVVVHTTTIPLAENVQPGSWTPYLKIPVPMVIPEQDDHYLYPIVVVRDSKTKDYYISKNRDMSVISLEIPYDGVSPGKVQSIYLNRKTSIEKVTYLESFDLVQLFPR
ncbi:hypothetical protein ADIARSV_1073 [Arcticibacter svalbardensis MN12-7]|uniref:DUF3823 domain-containing protein n=1 Tax=Arcticibacter svalbardensis MN12-7 TaxID=1150600 RepID=R9GW62_9SPHI|nr:hypothetical protein [Arcticibacter svalbardensis]EOR95760.1 hypothetical protein ADIARSV_1073 [Arcticibacter svalbardensis MN12-7]